jgi:hypothetical protein
MPLKRLEVVPSRKFADAEERITEILSLPDLG